MKEEERGPVWMRGEFVAPATDDDVKGDVDERKDDEEVVLGEGVDLKEEGR